MLHSPARTYNVDYCKGRGGTLVNGKRWIGIWLLTAVMLGTAGCGSISIPDGEGGKTTISLKDKDVTVKGADGSEGKISVDDKGGTVIEGKNADGTSSKTTFSDGKKLPDGFPKEITIPEGGTVLVSVSSTESSRKSFMVTLAYAKPTKEVIKLFQDMLKTGGYSDVTDSVLDNVGMMSGKKGSLQLGIIIMPDDSKDIAKNTNVQLTVDVKN